MTEPKIKSLEAIALHGRVAKITMADIEEAGWTLRKNKTFADVTNAFRKGMKNGMLRTEVEISMTELYLGDVLKRKRV